MKLADCQLMSTYERIEVGPTGTGFSVGSHPGIRQCYLSL